MKNPIIAFVHSFSNLTIDISKFANKVDAIKDDIEKEKDLIENMHVLTKFIS